MQFQSLRVAVLYRSTVKSRSSLPVLCHINRGTGCRFMRTRPWPMRIGDYRLGASHRHPRRLMSDGGKGNEEGSMYLIQAGLPLFLFCGLGVWVVSNGIDGKNRERDAFQGRISKYVFMNIDLMLSIYFPKLASPHTCPNSMLGIIQ